MQALVGVRLEMLVEMEMLAILQTAVMVVKILVVVLVEADTLWRQVIVVGQE